MNEPHEGRLASLQFALAESRREFDAEKQRHEEEKARLAERISAAIERRNAAVVEAKGAGLSNTKIATALGMTLPSVAHILNQAE